METTTIQKDVKVFGKEVKTFPAGVNDAFKELIDKTGDASGKRNYYGVSSMNNEGKMVYTALAEEKYEGEADKYGYEKSKIEKGEYLTEKLEDWVSKTDCIKDIFHKMMEDKRSDLKKLALNGIRMMKKCFAWLKQLINKK